MKTIPALALALLAGCASLGKDECRSADWYAIGLEDGSRGRALERLGDHRRACAKHGIAPQTERYLAGRDDGLKSFCTYENGYARGRAGGANPNTCAPPAAAGFAAGYQRGRELHELHRALAENRREVGRIKDALAAGIPDPRARAVEVVRLEARLREQAELEARISRLE